MWEKQQLVSTMKDNPFVLSFLIFVSSSLKYTHVHNDLHTPIFSLRSRARTTKRDSLKFLISFSLCLTLHLALLIHWYVVLHIYTHIFYSSAAFFFFLSHRCLHSISWYWSHGNSNHSNQFCMEIWTWTTSNISFSGELT